MQNDNGPMPVAQEVDSPSPNGHATYPSGVGAVLADEGERGRQGQPEYRDFMTAHTDNMARLLAEAVLDEDLLEQYLLVMEHDQQIWGYVSMPSIIKAKVAGTIGLKARGREDAVRVATAPGAMMRRAAGFARRMFGMGGGGMGGGGGMQQSPGGDFGY